MVVVSLKLFAFMPLTFSTDFFRKPGNYSCKFVRTPLNLTWIGGVNRYCHYFLVNKDGLAHDITMIFLVKKSLQKSWLK